MPLVHTPPMHDAVHDLESFFWVLLWLCLSRVGPGVRRSELSDLTSTSLQEMELKKTFYALFDEDNPAALGLYKQKCLVSNHMWLDKLTAQFTPFYGPLQYLVEDF